MNQLAPSPLAHPSSCFRRTSLWLINVTCLLLVCMVANLSAGELPSFREHVIVTDIKFGYQLVAVDLTGDGRKDLIVID